MQIGRGSNDHIGRMVMRGATLLLGGRIVRILFTVIGVAVLARLLTPADFGVVAVASMILSFSMALLDGLIDVPAIREDGLDRQGLANLIWMGVVLMAGLGAAVWLAAPVLSVLLNSPRLDESLRLTSVGLLLQPFITAGYALLRREHRFDAVAIFLAVSGAAYVISAIGFALLGLGLWSLIAGQIVSLVITALGLGAVSAIPLRPPHRILAAAAWRLGGAGLAARLLAWMSTSIDTLFASAALGPAGAGIYSRAYNLTTQIAESFAVLDQVVRQAFVAQRTINDVAASRATLAGLRLVVIAAALAAAGIIALREPLVAVLLGAQWGAVTLPLAILAASLPARVARLYLDGFTYARGSMRHMLLRNMVTLTLLVVGLCIWATEGVEEIALVVAAVHAATLFFRGGPVDVAVAGTRMDRLAAMAPGYVVGAVIVGMGEFQGVLFPTASELVDWSLRAAVCGIMYILVAAVMPDRWLPGNICRLRRRFYPARRRL